MWGPLGLRARHTAPTQVGLSFLRLSLEAALLVNCAPQRRKGSMPRIALTSWKPAPNRIASAEPPRSKRREQRPTDRKVAVQSPKLGRSGTPLNASIDSSTGQRSPQRSARSVQSHIVVEQIFHGVVVLFQERRLPDFSLTLQP